MNICIYIFFKKSLRLVIAGRGEEGQPRQSLVRTTLSSFSSPNHLGILVLRLFCVKKFPILEDKTIL